LPGILTENEFKHTLIVSQSHNRLYFCCSTSGNVTCACTK
jgi:hypothetical protein